MNAVVLPALFFLATCFSSGATGSSQGVTAGGQDRGSCLYKREHGTRPSQYNLSLGWLGHGEAVPQDATTASDKKATPFPNKPIRVVVIGDSTVASTEKNAQGRYNRAGWGQFLGDAFDDSVTVINCAAPGRSSSSFVWEGRWAKALANKPDYVFIQFGHNDCPGKGIRETDPKTTFRDYLRKYVYYARQAQAKPILVTPMTRRQFDEHDKIKTILRPYAEAMLAVGREEKVPVIDLHAASVELFNRLGDVASSDLSCGEKDRTHFSEKGARVILQLIIDRLPQADPALAGRLKPRIHTDSPR